METRRKQPKKPKIVTKPYLTGTPVDKHFVKSALKLFGGMIGAAFLFLIAGAVLLVENAVVRIALNSLAMLVVYALFFVSGMSTGTAAVNLGEMLHTRRESGRDVSAAEQSLCYHPLKGFLVGLTGAIPFFVCAVLLALTAQLHLTGLSPLPSWVSGLQGREEITDALAYYAAVPGVTLEDIVRMPIRMALMPLVGMIGSENAAGLLLLERVSPVLMLIPGLCYGTGYTRGVSARTQVHTSIAANNRKRARREKKQLKARAARKSEQLN